MNIDDLLFSPIGKLDDKFSGIFIHVGRQPLSKRYYSVSEIQQTVTVFQYKIDTVGLVSGYLLGNTDQDPTIYTISHNIIKVWIDDVGNAWCECVILKTLCGNLLKSILKTTGEIQYAQSGTGYIDTSGVVSDYRLMGIDIVVASPALLGEAQFPKKD